MKRTEGMDGKLVLICTGDFSDPKFHKKFSSVYNELKGLLCEGRDSELQLRKMESWNSVRVTFSIGCEAAERLRHLAQVSGEVLARLGILSVQLPNQQVISVAPNNSGGTPPNTQPPQPAATPATSPPSSASNNQVLNTSERLFTSQPAAAPPPPPYEPQGSLLVNLLQNEQGEPSPNERSAFSRPVQPTIGGGLTPTALSAITPTIGPNVTPTIRPGITPTIGPSITPTMGPGIAQTIGNSITPTIGSHVTQMGPNMTPNIGSMTPTVGLGMAPTVPTAKAPTTLSLPSVIPNVLPAATPKTTFNPPEQRLSPVNMNAPVNSESQTHIPDRPPAPPSTGGKSVQYLINPLTGVLEPAVTDSSSDSEQEQLSQPILPPSPPAQLPVAFKKPEETPPLCPVEQPASTIPVSVTNNSIATSTTEVATRCTSPVITAAPPPPPAAPVPAPTLPTITNLEPEQNDELKPKPEEKIKLRLKLGSTLNSESPVQNSELRVPPLHISLRGRPVVLPSRKEKRKKDEEPAPSPPESSPSVSTTSSSSMSYEGTCQFPSEAEVASILRSMPPGGKLSLAPTSAVTSLRLKKKDKKKIYPRTVPRVEEKLKKNNGSLLKSVVKSASRIMTAQRSVKPLHKQRHDSGGGQTPQKPPQIVEAESEKSKESATSTAEHQHQQQAKDSSEHQTDKIAEPPKSPAKTDEGGGKTKDKETGSAAGAGGAAAGAGAEEDDLIPLRVTPALYTYSNPERQREETPSPENTEEDRFSSEGLILKQLLVDSPNTENTDRTKNRLMPTEENSSSSSPAPATAAPGKRSRGASAESPTPRPSKRKCTENLAGQVKTTGILEAKKDTPPPIVPTENDDLSDDETKKKEEENAKTVQTETKTNLDDKTVRTSFNTRRSARQSEIRDQRPARKAQLKKEEPIIITSKRRRNSKEK